MLSTSIKPATLQSLPRRSNPLSYAAAKRAELFYNEKRNISLPPVGSASIAGSFCEFEI